MTQSEDTCSLHTWSMGNSWAGAGGGSSKHHWAARKPRDSHAHMADITPPSLPVPPCWTKERTQEPRVMVSGPTILLLTLQWNQRPNDSKYRVQHLSHRKLKFRELVKY